MNRQELSQGVLGSILIFKFLQFFDERREDKSDCAKRILEEFFEQYYPEINTKKARDLPFLHLSTTLEILSVLFFYAVKVQPEEWLKAGFTHNAKYEITYFLHGKKVDDPTIPDILKTIRNALAHLPDFLSGERTPNTSYSEGYLSFSSDWRNSKINFADKVGFAEFLKDFINAIQKVLLPTLQSRA